MRISKQSAIAGRLNKLLSKKLSSKDYGRLGRIVKSHDFDSIIAVLEYFESNPEVYPTLGLFQWLVKKEEEKDFFEYESIQTTIDRNRERVNKLLGELIE